MEIHCIEIIKLYHKIKLDGSGEIRTHEACALDLKTNPFDRSGTLPDNDIIKLK